MTLATLWLIALAVFLEMCESATVMDNQQAMNA
jgi:hypothetical protein